MPETPAAFEAIQFSIADGVAHIILNRPDAANALNGKMSDELSGAAWQCENDPSVRVILISANGKMFCAGGDLKYFLGFGDNFSSAVQGLLDSLHDVIVRLVALDAPIVTAVNGVAAGGGLCFVSMADYVLAARSASFTAAFTAAGLSPDSSSTYFLPRVMGLRRAQEFILLNRRLSADEAQEWGLVSRVVEDDQLMVEARNVAAQLAVAPTRALGRAKRLLAQSSQNTLADQVKLEAAAFAENAATHDAMEGIQAFAEKRKPVFEGR